MEPHRRRFPGREDEDVEDYLEGTKVDDIVAKQQSLQERIAESMLSQVTQLKMQSLAAEKIIRQDCRVLSQSSRLMDSNSTRLDEKAKSLGTHRSAAGGWWYTVKIWLLLIVVFIIFLYMVIFIRMTRK